MFTRAGPASYQQNLGVPLLRHNDLSDLLSVPDARVNLDLVNYAQASWIATLDVDLTTGVKLGGGTPTDNTAALNSFLASGSAITPIDLFLDGATADTGILIPAGGNVRIRGRGLRDGFFTKSASNTFGIANHTRNQPPAIPFDYVYSNGYVNPGAPALVNVGSLILEDFFINGNVGTINGLTGVVDGTLSTPYDGSAFGPPNGTGSEKGYRTIAPDGTPNYGTGALPSSPTIGQYAIITNGSTSTDMTTRAGAFKVCGFWTGSAWVATCFIFYSAIDLFNLNYVRLKNVRVLDSPAYGIRLGNVSNVSLEDVIIGQTTYRTSGNDDGLHIDGPASSVTIRGGSFNNVADDNIAINALEGYGGEITSAVVDSVTFNTAGEAVNVLGNVVSLKVVNCYGSVKNSFLRILPGLTGTVDVANCVLTPIGGCIFATIAVGAGTSGTTINNLILRDNKMIGPNNTTAFCSIITATVVADTIVLAGNAIQMTVASHGAMPLFGLYANSTVGRLVIDGFRIENPAGQSYAIPYAVERTAGTINELVINSINPRYITALVSSWTGISRVSGSGLLASGYSIPDALVVNGVPYFSAEASLPSIKIGGTPNGIDGTVKRFTIS